MTTKEQRADLQAENERLKAAIKEAIELQTTEDWYTLQIVREQLEKALKQCP